MRHVWRYLALAAGLAACQGRDGATTGPAPDPQFSASAARAAYRVVGGGSIVREDVVGSPRETYGFEAQVNAAGHATGWAEVYFPSDIVKMHIAVQCLVVEANRAWMSGPVTRSDDPETPVGRVFLWLVQDFGEGVHAPPDRISNFLHRPADNFPPDICLEKRALTTYPWDNGSVQILTPGVLGLADLVGTWDAVLLRYISLPDYGDTVDLGSEGARARWTVAPSGNASMIYFADGLIFEDTPGTTDVVDGKIAVQFGGGQGAIVGQGGVTGNTLWGNADLGYGYDWDGDGQDDDATRVEMEWARVRVETTVADVAGTWHATTFRWRSVADPTQVWDLLAHGGYYTLTVWLNGYAVSDAWGSTATVALVFDGGRMLTRAAGEARTFAFTLGRGTWSFTGPYAFDVNGDETPEPATLEAVLVR
jgi:hypothetical protein